MKKYRINTVIINYKTAQMTMDCVRSLERQLDREKDCIVIVDNCSGSNDMDILSSWIDQKVRTCDIHLIPSDLNGGFSYGNNLGIRHSPAEYYLLTNSDTLIREGAIEGLLEGMEIFPDAGLVGPRLIWPDGSQQTSCFRFRRPLCEVIIGAETSTVTRIFNKYDIPLEIPDGIFFTEWISFASVMVRSSVIDVAGLMDEDFFMYFEDIDYCIRAREKGFAICYYPRAEVVHLIGKSSGLEEKVNSRKPLPTYYYESRSLYYRKHYGYFGFLRSNFFWYLGRSVSLFREIILGKRKNITINMGRDIWKRNNRRKKHA